MTGHSDVAFHCTGVGDSQHSKARGDHVALVALGDCQGDDFSPSASVSILAEAVDLQPRWSYKDEGWSVTDPARQTLTYFGTLNLRAIA